MFALAVFLPTGGPLSMKQKCCALLVNFQSPHHLKRPGANPINSFTVHYLNVGHKSQIIVV